MPTGDSTAKVVGNNLVLNNGQLQGIADGTASTHGATVGQTAPATHATQHKSGGTDVIKLNELGAPTAAVALNSQKITGLADGTASGDAIHAGQVGAASNMSRLGVQRVAGTTGKFLDAGSSIPIAHLNDTFVVKEDFAGIVALTTGTILQPGVIATFNGTPATIQADTATEIGYQVLPTGTGTTGAAGISSATVGVSVIPATASEVYYSAKVGVGFLSDGTTKYNGMFGLTSGPATITGTSGIAFWIDQTTPVANWMAVVGSGTMTPVATGLATVGISAGQLYHLEIYKAAGSGTVDFYIDGVHVHSTSTSVPTATRLNHTQTIVKSAGGTSVGLHVDWIELYVRAPSRRNASFLA